MAIALPDAERQDMRSTNREEVKRIVAEIFAEQKITRRQRRLLLTKRQYKAWYLMNEVGTR